MICDRCGRLLNRATGRCPVCLDSGAAPPPPVAVTHPPLEAPRPISAAAAMAVLSPADRVNARPVAAARHEPPQEPAAGPVREPGAPVGVVRRLRVGRRRWDLLVYEGSVVLARRSKVDPTNLTAGQAAAAHPSNRTITAAEVDDVEVREDAVSGRAWIRLRKRDPLVLAWWAWRNRGVAVENLLSRAFPGSVDQAPAQVPLRVAKAVGAAGAAVVLVVLAVRGATALAPDEPPPPPPAVAPPVTLPPAEQAARSAVAPACASWTAFAANIPTGERPTPAALRPVADGARPGFDQAVAASADYAPARDELAYLQGYARRPAPEAAKESLARVQYAVETISGACARATG